jgi:hypothetical protein
VRADPLVNRAFQPFCFFRNRSFEGRSKPPGKPRGYPSTQSNDSIEARNLTDPTARSKMLFQALAPNKTPKTKSPKPAGPARLRARRGYRRRLGPLQADSAPFADFLRQFLLIKNLVQTILVQPWQLSQKFTTTLEFYLLEWENLTV